MSRWSFTDQTGIFPETRLTEEPEPGVELRNRRRTTIQDYKSADIAYTIRSKDCSKKKLLRVAYGYVQHLKLYTYIAIRSTTTIHKLKTGISSVIKTTLD